MRQKQTGLKTLEIKHLASAEPGEVHYVLARLEAAGLLKMLITQNIDSVLLKIRNKAHFLLHTEAC